MIRDMKGREYNPRITVGVLMDYERATGIKFWVAAHQSGDALVPGLAEMFQLFHLAIRWQYPKLGVADVADIFDGAAVVEIHRALHKGVWDFFPTPPAEPEAAENPGPGPSSGA